MSITYENIILLLDSLKMDRSHVVCHFKCDITNRTVISKVPFEPYEGKIKIRLQDMLLHPVESYNRYYHTPITIYNGSCNKTIVLKAFEKVSQHFVWSKQRKRYIYAS
jgi:hypothetical protein